MEDEQRKRMFENQIKDITNSDKIIDNNKSIILEFLKVKQGQGLTFNRLNRLCVALKPIFNVMNYDVRTIDGNKVQNIIISINGNAKWKDWTKNSNVKVLKNFLRWLNKTYNIHIDLLQ